MKSHPPTLSTLTRLLSRNFLWLLLGVYAAAVAFPSAGNRVRETVLAESAAVGVKLTMPLLLLSVLFVNVGIDLTRRGRRSQASAGSVGIVVASGWTVPLILLLLARALIGTDLSELQHQLFLGMVLVAAMPIANSSSAWAHNLGADVGHSVFSLIWSTLLAPIVSVLLVSWLWLDGSVGDGLRETLSVQIVAGLLGCVVIPIAIGAGLSNLWPALSRPAASDASKLVNMAILLILNYSNAALALPHAFRERQFASLLLTFACASLMCACMLLSAKLLSALRKWSMPLAASAALSMSMKNTGTALVLAGTVLAPGSMAILVIVAYTLVQHILVSVAIGPVQNNVEPRPVKAERVRQDSEPPIRTATHAVA